MSYLRTIASRATPRSVGYTPKTMLRTFSSAKRALLIGINYVGTPYELRGCIDDVETMAAYYQSIGVSEIMMLTDTTSTKPTLANILQGLRWLTSSSGDLYLHFSGHGAPDSSTADPTDSCLCALDGFITDTDLRAYLDSHLLPGATLFACFDACNNGTGLNLRYVYDGSATRVFGGGCEYNGHILPPVRDYDANQWIHTLELTEDTRYAPTKSRVVFLSGSRDTETCIDAYEEGRPQGAMTWALRKALGRASTLRELVKITACTLSAAGYTQHPCLSLGRPEDLDTKAF